MIAVTPTAPSRDRRGRIAWSAAQAFLREPQRDDFGGDPNERPAPLTRRPARRALRPQPMPRGVGAAPGPLISRRQRHPVSRALATGGTIPYPDERYPRTPKTVTHEQRQEKHLTVPATMGIDAVLYEGPIARMRPGRALLAGCWPTAYAEPPGWPIYANSGLQTVLSAITRRWPTP